MGAVTISDFQFSQEAFLVVRLEAWGITEYFLVKDILLQYNMNLESSIQRYTPNPGYFVEFNSDTYHTRFMYVMGASNAAHKSQLS